MAWSIGPYEPASGYTEVEGTTCWGHDTGVTETNVRDFSGNWSGTGSVTGSGDSEELTIASGQYMECSDIIATGARTVTIEANHYAAGDSPVIKYKTAATAADCYAGTSWTTYSAPFASSGYVQIRVENA